MRVLGAYSFILFLQTLHTLMKLLQPNLRIYADKLQAQNACLNKIVSEFKIDTYKT